ncbi:MAG: adenylate/guanylate cyclase domain-containing protein [Betaproteobacteria bacterium]|nr:adenylate/guanylate cyclase domain-containing protein [Betaproteobacteria bacterium]
MQTNLLQNGIRAIARIGSQPDDSEELRVKKALVTSSVFGSFFSISLFAITYTLFDAQAVGILFWGWLAFQIINLAIQALVPAFYRWFALGQLLVFVLVTIIRMIVLGGFINAGGQVLFVVIVPLGALILYSARHSLYWFLIYLMLVAADIAMQFYAPPSPLPHGIQLVLLAISSIVSALFVFGILFYFVSQRDLAFRLLRGEQEKSETLLLNILPHDIAAILKNEQRLIADHFDAASILFADVVNFTPMSATMTPTELVELLNEVFSYFDSLVEKYGLEKIKTIGDCYMVASGVPRPRADHAQVLTRMALEMRDYVRQHEFRERSLAFRIGLNSGAVVAGVIGRKKFIYDLWGDAVNTASRMESHGQGGNIQITRATHNLVKDDFMCEPRGTVNIKGKGEMEVWFVVGQKSNVTLTPAQPSAPTDAPTAARR